MTSATVAVALLSMQGLLAEDLFQVAGRQAISCPQPPDKQDIAVAVVARELFKWRQLREANRPSVLFSLSPIGGHRAAPRHGDCFEVPFPEAQEAGYVYCVAPGYEPRSVYLASSDVRKLRKLSPPVPATCVLTRQPKAAILLGSPSGLIMAQDLPGGHRAEYLDAVAWSGRWPEGIEEIANALKVRPSAVAFHICNQYLNHTFLPCPSSSRRSRSGFIVEAYDSLDEPRVHASFWEHLSSIERSAIEKWILGQQKQLAQEESRLVLTHQLYGALFLPSKDRDRVMRVADRLESLAPESLEIELPPADELNSRSHVDLVVSRIDEHPDAGPGRSRPEERIGRPEGPSPQPTAAGCCATASKSKTAFLTVPALWVALRRRRRRS